MKQFAAIVLTLLILSSVFKDFAVYLSFKINQQYIIENVCVQKELLDENTCNGSCELTRQLLKVQTDNSESDNSLPKFSSEKRDYVRESLVVAIFTPLLQINSNFEVTNEELSVQEYIRGIFRPPQV